MRTSAGLLSLIALAAAFTACNSSDDDSASPSNSGGGNSGLTINSTEGIQVTIDGTSSSYSAGNPLFAGFNSDVGGNLFSFSYGLSNYNTMHQIYEVELGVVQGLGGATIPDSIFFKIGLPGTRGYADPEAHEQGVYFSWFDASGEEWSTRCGSGVQTGSLFTITDRQERPSDVPTAMKLRATFNCKLYKCSDPTQVKTVTNGVMVFSLRNL